jgi:hypothetical protein
VFVAIKKFLRSLFKSFPVVQPVEFSDGLLAFRCDRPLAFEPTTVASLTPQGSVMARLDVMSYDVGQRLYRARVLDPGATLQRMEIPVRGAVRLPQAVRVSSREIPKYFALTEDISVSGLRLATKMMLPAGATLEMAVDLDDPSLPTIRIKGEVRWSGMKGDGSYHSGVSFLGIDKGQRRILERYIDTRLVAQRTVHGDA